MVTRGVEHVLVLALTAVFVNGQNHFMCPPNPKLGLCEQVSNPCLNDMGCPSGMVCCPESCSRTCKMPGASQGAQPGEFPDLLHHPTVYVGKCADSSCFNLFGGDPNECDTSNLCEPRKFCCNDGCKNVCKWKPEFEVIVKQQEARRRQEQAILMQRQKAQLEEYRRRMEERRIELLKEQQRLAAQKEQERQQAAARAAAEAELKAQQAKAAYQARMKALADAQAATISHMAQASQQLLQQQQQTQTQNVQQQQQQQQQQPSGGTSFLDNFTGNSQTALTSSNQVPANNNNNNNNNNVNNNMIMPGNIPPSGNTNNPPPNQNFFNAGKSTSLAGPTANQVDSFANRSPYAHQQNIYSKGTSNSIPTWSQIALSKSAGLLPPQNLAPSGFPTIGQSQTQLYPNQPASTYPGQSQSAGIQRQPISRYPSVPQRMPIQQRYPPASRSYTQRAPSQTNPVNPLLMLHYMRTAA